jgi:hypothetical protein
VRSILWLASAQRVLEAAGEEMPPAESIMRCLAGKVAPGATHGEPLLEIPAPAVLAESA